MTRFQQPDTTVTFM